MKGLFLVLIILVIVIYYIYGQISNKIERNLIYVMGVYKHNIIDKKIISNIMKLAEERDIAIIVKEYDSYFKLLNDCNSYKIDFAILPEDFFIDSCLGLNVFKDRTKINNHYVISLYFNYLYFLSEPFYIDESRTQKFTNLSQLTNFKKVHKRNYVIGTEEPQSNSYMNMILILNMYGLNPINFSEYDANETYKDNDVFYINASKTELHRKIKNKSIDGIFVMDIQTSRFVSMVAKSSNIVFINLDLEKTIFDSIFSNYYSKKTLSLDKFYNTDFESYFQKNNITPANKITYFNNIDIDSTHISRKAGESVDSITTNLGVFDTRSIRSVLVSNNKIGKDIVYKITELILRNNNFLINKVVFNKFSNVEHDQFEPVDIIYIDKHIRYHAGARKLYEEMNFITFDKKKLKDIDADAAEKFDEYWKLSKIGMNRFKFIEDKAKV